MIEPLRLPISTQHPVSEIRYTTQSCSRSSIASLSDNGSFFSWVISPIVNALNFLFYRISPSIEEYELFEEILEGSFRGAAFHLYDQKMGEEEVRQTLVKCEALYESLSNKWFPNLEGILFMRVALLKVKLRMFAALGEEKKRQECENLLKSLSVVLSDELQMQISLLQLIKKRPYRFFLAIGNSLIKGLLAFRIRGRRDSNSQLPP